jgi:hypothetical protein
MPHVRLRARRWWSYLNLMQVASWDRTRTRMSVIRVGRLSIAGSLGGHRIKDGSTSNNTKAATDVKCESGAIPPTALECPSDPLATISASTPATGVEMLAIPCWACPADSRPNSTFAVQIGSRCDSSDEEQAPVVLKRRPCCATIASTSPWVAPIAIRIPISRVWRLAEYATRP